MIDATGGLRARRSVATTLADPPSRLRAVHRPLWPGIGALAEGLGISAPGLWRLTRSASRQRQAPLGEQHYRYELLPKRTGGWRLLEVPHPWLRALQRRVLDELVSQVPRELMALCTTATPEPVLGRLRAGGGLSWERSVRLRDAHQPQGAPTSAALANLCAFRLDVRIAALARAAGARHTRYADDIVLSGGHNLLRGADRIEARIGGFALDEGFALNHRKTRRASRGRRQQVCNIVVNATPTCRATISIA